MSGRRAAWERAAAGLLLVLFASLGGVSLLRDASVADEHPHILSGWLYWQSGRFSGGFDNPPLGQLLVASPLHLLHLPYRFPSDEHLPWCRLPVLVCGVGLGMVLWRWGRVLAGAAGGLAVLAGLCLEPNLLAHAHLATLDLPVAFFWWLALWAWRRHLRSERAPLASCLPFALVFAAATLTKFTGLLLAPAALVVALVACPGRRRRGALGVAVALVLVVPLAHVAYGFGPTHLGLPAQLVAGVAGKLAHREEVRFAYLAGRRSESGFLLYYAVALLVKTPLPLLLLAALGFVRLWRRRAGLDLALLVAPAALVVAAFTLVRVNVGVRHVLPVYPALLLAAAVGGRALWEQGRLGRAALVALTLAWSTGVARVMPQHLAYFNILAAGPAGGHRWLLDSNLDWGQDDRRLAAFLEEAARRGERWEVDPDPLVARPGRFAVSANALHNLQRRGDRPYDWLRLHAPVGFAGGSWRLYDVTPAAIESQAARAPESVAARIAAAQSLVGAGEWERARAELVAASAHLGDRADFAARAAAVAERAADVETAREWIHRGLARHPQDPELLALAHERALSEALAAGGADSARAALELGLWRAESGRLEAALPLLERAAAAAPVDVETQRALAVALAHAGRYSEAARVLDRDDLRAPLAAELDLTAAFAAAESALDAGDTGLDPDLLFELGRAHFEANRYAAAAGAFAAVLAARPADGQALAYVGEMQVRSKLRVVEERLAPRRIVPRGSRR